MLALLNSPAYNVVKTLHILTVIAGFGPLLWATVVAMRAKAVGGEVGAALIDTQAAITRFAEYCLGATLILGFALSGMSSTGGKDPKMANGFAEPWVGASTLLLLIGLGLLGGLLSPAQKQIAAAMRRGDTAEMASLEKKLIPASAGANLCFTIAVFLMVLKPG